MIQNLTFDELSSVNGGVTSTQVRDFGSAALSFAGAAAVVGAEPVAAMAASVAVTSYLVAGLMDL